MSSLPRHRRKRKIRRTGQHTTPSQVEKVAQTAGKAAPAVVVVGTLATTAPHIGGAAAASAAATAPHVVRAHLDDAALPAGRAHAASTEAAASRTMAARAAAHATAGRTYTVQAGNTLSGITERFYGKDADWRSLYAANESKISNPNMIFVGEELRLPRHLPPPRPWRPSRHPGAARTRRRTPPGTPHPGRAPVGQPALRGDHHEPVRHAELLRPGSSVGRGGRIPRGRGHRGVYRDGGVRGNQFATGTVGERGYWQINPVNGSLSTYDPYGNARAAVIMSGNGINWSPWTTYTSGAYAGRC